MIVSMLHSKGADYAKVLVFIFIYISLSSLMLQTNFFK